MPSLPWYSDVPLEMPEGLPVVLNGALFSRLGESERRLASCVADGAIRSEALLEQPQEHRNLPVDVVVDPNLGLCRMRPVKASAVLDERALPRDRHREEEGVETGVVEALADVATRREDEALGRVQNRGKLIGGATLLLGGHSALQHEEVAHESAEVHGKVLEVIFPLREEDGRSSLLKRLGPASEPERSG